jgi:sulfur-carrier protein
MATVTLRYWAAARTAAGMPEQVVDADTLAAALASVTGAEANAELRRVLARSSFLVDGIRVGPAAAESLRLADGAVIEVLPPFAGG